MTKKLKIEAYDPQKQTPIQQHTASEGYVNDVIVLQDSPKQKVQKR
jgi:hypothetical protein